MANEVREGQMWLDLDARPTNRTLLVVWVGDTHASCKVFRDGQLTGRSTTIRLDRFKPGSRGYELILAHRAARVSAPPTEPERH